MIRNNFKRKLNNESGAMQIIEATIVFPIMFIILYFLVYLGNAFYIRSQIDSVVAMEAIKGAAYCADPLLEQIKSNGGVVPSLDKLDVQPYRYFGGMNEVESKISKEVVSEISGSSTSLFKNMKPKQKSLEVKYNNYILYSSFSVEAKYSLEMPIKFFGSQTPYLMTINSRSEVAVNDSAEFIRNTDMVIDYFESTKVGQTIKGVFEKINSFITSFAEK